LKLTSQVNFGASQLERSTLTSTLLEHGLADEVLLVVYPAPRSFELVNTKAMPSWALASVPAGPW
jgi:hypothetical protein